MEGDRQEFTNPLIEHVLLCFERAKAAKVSIEERMIRNLYTFKNLYTPEKKKRIEEIGGSDIFLPLTNIKCRALKAWLVEIFFSSGEPPFDISPTPVPELEEDLEARIKEEVKSEISSVIQQVNLLSQLSGGSFGLDKVAPLLKKSIDNVKDRVADEIREQALKIADREKRRINDQFIEGGFYDALDECLFDIAIFPCAIMKSCVPRRVKRFGSGRSVIEKVIPTYNRVSPFDIYPSPVVPDFSDWVIEILHLTPQDLYLMKGVEGYYEDAIDVILGLYSDVGYEISTNQKSERLLLEGKSSTNYSLIDVIEFWGSVRGSLIKQADIEIDGISKSDIDDDTYYDVCIWVCDGYILRFVFNPDPLGMKPYHKASFIEVPDSFWGLSLVDVLYDLQMGVNAIARATINNAALSSGPMVERNIDRVPPDEEKIIIPWKIFDATSFGVTSEPAYRFYQPSLTANALVQVAAYFMKLADELSGIPSYAHGDVTLGGSASRTASGLSMLITNASRGIKEVVKNIDKGIIEPTVKRTYNFNIIDFYGLGEEIPDLNIQAKGSIILMEKMAQIQKLLELLNLTNNPVDLQLIGIEGRRYLLEHIFKNFGVAVPMRDDLEEMISSLQNQLAQLSQQKPPPAKERDGITEMAQDLRMQSMGSGDIPNAPKI